MGELTEAEKSAHPGWKQLYQEYAKLWREADAKLAAVGEILERDGCSCDCDCIPSEGHADDCGEDPCLACRICRVVQP